MSSSSRPRAPLRNRASGPTNLSAFHCGGLWLAVIAMPPFAFSRRTRSCTVGVGQTPASSTRQPDDNNPETTACRTISPGRPRVPAHHHPPRPDVGAERLGEAGEQVGRQRIADDAADAGDADLECRDRSHDGWLARPQKAQKGLRPFWLSRRNMSCPGRSAQSVTPSQFSILNSQFVSASASPSPSPPVPSRALRCRPRR